MTINYFIIFSVGIVSVLLIVMVLNKFPDRYELFLEKMIEQDSHFRRKDMRAIVKESYSLIFIGENTPGFLAVNLLASLILMTVVIISKNVILLLLATFIAFAPSVIIEIFVMRNRNKREKNKWGLEYRVFRRRIRPALYSTSGIPMLISLLIIR